MPICSINLYNQSSVKKISKYIYLIMTLCIIYGIPGIEIAIKEFIGKKEISSILLHIIWKIIPIIIFIGVYCVKVILPSSKYFSTIAFISLKIIYYGMFAIDSIFSGKIV